MATLITRSGKAAAISASEHDENMKRETNAQSGAYTVIADDNRATVEYTGSGGHTITLPDVSTLLAAEDTGDFQVTIKNNGTGSVTVAPAALNTIDGVDRDLVLYVDDAITLKAGSVTDDWMIINSTSRIKALLTGSGTTSSLSGANYSQFFGGNSGQVTSTVLTRTVIPISGTLKNFYYRPGTNSANGTVTVTLYVDGISTGITVTVDAAATSTVSDTTNSAVVSAGSYIEIVHAPGTSTTGTHTGFTCGVSILGP